MTDRNDSMQGPSGVVFDPAIGALPPRATISARSYTYAAAVEATDVTLAASSPTPPSTLPSLPTITLGFPAASRGGLDPSPRPHDMEVRELLGEGGMGKVYVALQRSLGRDVAVKVLRSDAPEAVEVAALVAEARTAGMLEHPRIVPVHALGVDALGRPLLVMKRVRGVAWSSLLDDAAHPAWATLLARGGGDRLSVHLEVLSAVCDALDCAHAAEVVHRDVKPDNVLVGEWGETYLTDWGVAARRDEHVSSPFRVVGTPAYMAPEMVLGHLGPPDARTDVYLLGATLHEVLTGRPRHAAESVMGALGQACLSAPVTYPPSVPGELAALCNRATSLERSARPASAGAFRAALQEFSRHRAAVRLTDEANTRLAELESAMSRKAPEAELARLATECRFGFLVALREWPEHEDARRGLDACLGRAAERELANGAIAAARSLMAELRIPRPDLEDRAAELEARGEVDRARAADNERIARDHDLSTDASRRVVFGTIMTVFVIALTGWGASRARFTVEDTIRYQAWAVLFAFVAYGASSRQGFRTAIDRQLAATLVVSNVMLFAHRALSYAVGATLHQTLVGDMVLIATVFAMMATFVERRFLASALVMFVAAVASSLWPAWTPAFFAAGTSAAIGLSTLMWLRWSAVAAKTANGA